MCKYNKKLFINHNDYVSPEDMKKWDEIICQCAVCNSERNDPEFQRDWISDLVRVQLKCKKLYEEKKQKPE